MFDRWWKDFDEQAARRVARHVLNGRTEDHFCHSMSMVVAHNEEIYFLVRCLAHNRLTYMMRPNQPGSDPCRILRRRPASA